MSSKRQSIMPSAPAGPKAPVHFSSSITIHDLALVAGVYPVTVSTESVVHPRAKLDSMRGPVNVGRRCIVSERAHVGAPPRDAAEAGGEEGSVTLGDYVSVETEAIIETGGTVVEEGSVIGVGSRVGRGAHIGKHCTLAPRSVIFPGEKIPDFTVVYGNGERRRDRRGVAELRNKAQTRQIEVLRKLLSSNPAKFM